MERRVLNQLELQLFPDDNNISAPNGILSTAQRYDEKQTTRLPNNILSEFMYVMNTIDLMKGIQTTN